MNISPKTNETTRSRLTYGRRHMLNDDDLRRSERTSFRIGRDFNHGRYDQGASEDPTTYRQTPDLPHYLHL